nr:phage holin family protein [Sphingomonas xinjiangensis]
MFGRLVEDGKSFARAEIGYYRVLLTGKLGEASVGIGFGVAAFALACSAVTALLVGLILSLATLIGPGLATLAVVIVTLSVAGLLGWFAYKHLMRVFGGAS